ncbi:hypothetical protein I7I48_10450 [Histoplasma ohiense]|nr:hypothetical protein I7I48_10450 [Histoplasma ohiense (nom. inval.)]
MCRCRVFSMRSSPRLLQIRMGLLPNRVLPSGHELLQRRRLRLSRRPMLRRRIFMPTWLNLLSGRWDLEMPKTLPACNN